jgi:hypothetical protein
MDSKQAPPVSNGGGRDGSIGDRRDDDQMGVVLLIELETEWSVPAGAECLPRVRGGS